MQHALLAIEHPQMGRGGARHHHVVLHLYGVVLGHLALAPVLPQIRARAAQRALDLHNQFALQRHALQAGTVGTGLQHQRLHHQAGFFLIRRTRHRFQVGTALHGLGDWWLKAPGLGQPQLIGRDPGIQPQHGDGFGRIAAGLAVGMPFGAALRQCDDGGGGKSGVSE